MGQPALPAPASNRSRQSQKWGRTALQRTEQAAVGWWGAGAAEGLNCREPDVQRQIDERSLHETCPVEAGKVSRFRAWTRVRWLRAAPGCRRADQPGARSCWAECARVSNLRAGSGRAR